MSTRAFFALVAVLSLAAGGLLWWSNRPAPAPAIVAMPASISPAALFAASFTDPSGERVPIGRFEGKVLLINFWATWCAPCREEIPLLVDLHGAYAGKGVEVVGIALDQLAKIQEFAANFKISYPLLVGDVRAIEILHALGNRAGALPYTVVLSRAGGIAWRKLGQVGPGELEPVLDDILG